MRDNLLQLKSNLRAKLFTLKRKVNSLSTSLEGLYLELDLVDQAFEKIDSELEIYKNRITRAAEADVRKLSRKLRALENQRDRDKDSVDTEGLKEHLIASTVSIFESIVYAICRNDSDFSVASKAALFSMVYSRLTGPDKFYLIDYIPDAAIDVVLDARKEFQEIRKAFQGLLTEPHNWNEASELVFDYWRDVALPKLYGQSDPRWSGDSPYSLVEMQTWDESEIERIRIAPEVNDAYLIQSEYKDDIIDINGVVTFNRLLMPTA